MQLLPNDEITLLCKLNVQSDCWVFVVFFLTVPKLFVSSVALPQMTHPLAAQKVKRVFTQL